MPKRKQQSKQNGKQITVGFKENGYRERLPWQQLQVGDHMVVPYRQEEFPGDLFQNLRKQAYRFRPSRPNKPDKNKYFVGVVEGGVAVWRIK